MLTRHTDDTLKIKISCGKTETYSITSHQLTLSKHTIFHSQLISGALFSSFRPSLFRTAIRVMLAISLVFRPYKDATISIISSHYLRLLNTADL